MKNEMKCAELDNHILNYEKTMFIYFDQKLNMLLQW